LWHTLCPQYGIKKKEEKEAEMRKKQEEKMAGADSGINRRKKTPEEIAAEQAAENQDDFTRKCHLMVVELNYFCHPAGLKNTFESGVNDLKGQIEEKCSLQ